MKDADKMPDFCTKTKGQWPEGRFKQRHFIEGPGGKKTEDAYLAGALSETMFEGLDVEGLICTDIYNLVESKQLRAALWTAVRNRMETVHGWNMLLLKEYLPVKQAISRLTGSEKTLTAAGLALSQSLARWVTGIINETCDIKSEVKTDDDKRLFAALLTVDAKGKPLSYRAIGAALGITAMGAKLRADAFRRKHKNADAFLSTRTPKRKPRGIRQGKTLQTQKRRKA